MWIVSDQPPRRKLQFLNYDVSIQALIGRDLIGKQVLDPVRHVTIPIYPASFVDPNSGTGIVMSVPAHAPYDYQALEDLEKIFQFNRNSDFLNVEEVKPITIIGIEDNPEMSDKSPSQSPNWTAKTKGALVSCMAEIMEKYNIKNQFDPHLQIATNEIYSQEFYRGTMLVRAGKLAGRNVSEAKEIIKRELLETQIADLMFELVDSSVKCRCGSSCVVKILEDQWFLDYGNEHWKKLAHQCINEMDIVPEDIRQEFNHVIDWLRERACAKKVWFGD